MPHDAWEATGRQPLSDYQSHGRMEAMRCNRQLGNQLLLNTWFHIWARRVCVAALIRAAGCAAQRPAARAAAACNTGRAAQRLDKSLLQLPLEEGRSSSLLVWTAPLTACQAFKPLHPGVWGTAHHPLVV